MLPTAIYYPAVGPAGAPVTGSAHPDTTFGPYPLIVFAPGFGTPPDLAPYPTLLERWAAAGFVVAAPTFPYTSSNSPGGPDLSDFPHQPADLSAVIDHVLAESAARHGPLVGMVDARHIGAAGHSLGGVTVLGLVANTCCRDRRIDAAVVMSGDAITFPSGAPSFAAAPPLLLVHGSADPTVPYVSSVEAFNAAHGPKGLLTVVGGDHGAPVDPTGRAFSSVVAATTDFFEAYLGHRAGALARMRAALRPGVTTLTFDAGRTTTVTLPVPTTTVGHLHATVTPDTGLGAQQTVTVSWQGFTPDVSVNVLQCGRNPPTVAGDCDLHTGVLLHADPTGSGSVPIVVHTGMVGTDGGVCGAAAPRVCDRRQSRGLVGARRHGDGAVVVRLGLNQRRGAVPQLKRTTVPGLAVAPHRLPLGSRTSWRITPGSVTGPPICCPVVGSSATTTPCWPLATHRRLFHTATISGSAGAPAAPATR